MQPASVQNSTVVLCWSVFHPHANNANMTWSEMDTTFNADRQITLELKNGQGFKPVMLPYSAYTACYQVCLVIM